MHLARCNVQAASPSAIQPQPHQLTKTNTYYSRHQEQLCGKSERTVLKVHNGKQPRAHVTLGLPRKKNGSFKLMVTEINLTVLVVMVLLSLRWTKRQDKVRQRQADLLTLFKTQ